MRGSGAAEGDDVAVGCMVHDDAIEAVIPARVEAVVLRHVPDALERSAQADAHVDRSGGGTPGFAEHQRLEDGAGERSEGHHAEQRAEPDRYARHGPDRRRLVRERDCVRRDGAELGADEDAEQHVDEVLASGQAALRSAALRLEQDVGDANDDVDREEQREQREPPAPHLDVRHHDELHGVNDAADHVEDDLAPALGPLDEASLVRVEPGDVERTDQPDDEQESRGNEHARPDARSMPSGREGVSSVSLGLEVWGSPKTARDKRACCLRRGHLPLARCPRRGRRPGVEA